MFRDSEELEWRERRVSVVCYPATHPLKRRARCVRLSGSFGGDKTNNDLKASRKRGRRVETERKAARVFTLQHMV